MSNLNQRFLLSILTTIFSVRLQHKIILLNQIKNGPGLAGVEFGTFSSYKF